MHVTARNLNDVLTTAAAYVAKHNAVPSAARYDDSNRPEGLVTFVLETYDYKTGTETLREFTAVHDGRMVVAYDLGDCTETATAARDCRIGLGSGVTLEHQSWRMLRSFVAHAARGFLPNVRPTVGAACYLHLTGWGADSQRRTVAAVIARHRAGGATVNRVA